MKFLNDTTSQIDRIVAKDPSRYNVNQVYFDARKCHLVATDGHVMAVVHCVPEEGDTTGWITPESLRAWRDALKRNRKLPQTVRFTCGEKLTVTTLDGVQSFERPAYEGNFPHYEAVMPKHVKEKPAFTVDIDLLYRLVEALGYPHTMTGKSRMVAIFPSKDNRSAHLVKTSQEGPIGIIMPVRANDEQEGWLTTLEAVDARFQKDLEASRPEEEKEKEKAA